MPDADILEKTWTVEALEGLTVELMADLLGREVGELSHELRTKAPTMPVDSLDMFDIVQEFRHRTGLKLPLHEIRSDTLRSVHSFAEFAVRGSSD